MSDLFLYQAGGVTLFLRGTVSLDFVATEVHVPGGGVLTLAVPVTIPAQFIAPLGGEFTFQSGTTGTAIQLSGQLGLGGAAALNFFGLPFDTTKQLDGRIVLNLPVGAATPGPDPFCLIEVIGSAEVRSASAGGQVFAGAAFGFGVVIDQLPTVPTIPPIPRLKFPDIGLHFPVIRLPWANPSTLSFPFPSVANPLRIPIPSLSVLKFLTDSPIKISWQSVSISANQNGGVALDFTELQIAGPYGAVTGDLHLQFAGTGAFDAGQSFFDMHKPATVHLPFSQWQFQTGAIALQWNGVGLGGWVGLLLPDLDDFQFETSGNPADHPPLVTLRLLSDAQGVSEARLDWQRKPNGTAFTDTIELPGFRITSTNAPTWTLLTRREGTGNRLGFVATLPQNDVVQAETVFNLNRGPVPLPAPGPGDDPDSQRAVHRKGSTADATPLATLKLTARQALSTVLIDTPLGQTGRTDFLKRLSAPLAPLDFANPATLFTPSPGNLTSLDSTSADLALTVNTDFDLPFLHRSDPGNGNQLLTLKKTTDPTVDPVGKQFAMTLEADLKLGSNLTLTSNFTIDFLWERFAFRIEDNDGIGFKLQSPSPTFEFLGLNWTFTAGEDNRILTLTTKDSNFTLKQAQGAKITASFSRATSAEEPIIFEVTNFTVGPAGVSFDATVSAAPARLNGLETRFQFTRGSLQVRDNHFAAFTIAGSGPLPPDLVGPAIADISLQFEQDSDGNIQLHAGSAQLRGSKLLKCQSTRFQFSIDGIGLKFVNDGGFHLYFTLTGKAKYVPFASDDTSGPLAWLGSIEIQLNECPLAGDARVLAKHISFLIDLPRKVSFSLLGCFTMEIRSLGFQPSFDQFADFPAAMQIGGQIKFVEGAGDVVDVRVDFHNLYVALPEKGSFLPRLHARGLGVKIKTGDAFDLEGSVDFLDGDEVAPGIKAKGFAGTGSLTIMGLPTMSANFAFLRVSRDNVTWVRAWFIYLQAGKLSLRIPVINIFIREVGLGFGYRFTLASIAAADELDDPKKLIQELTRLSLTQGNLSEASAWKVDLENPIGTPRWTVALRALIAQTSAAVGIMDWNQEEETELSCLFIMDAVIALRSDLTFLMDVRGWLYTNYNDFLVGATLKNNPLVSGFVLLSPPKKRFLAHFASNRHAEFGDHPPLFGFLKDALRDSYFSATLLIEPGLFHMELGWPNMLQWVSSLGPLQAEFRGGAIFRVSTTELVIGQSVSARGTLNMTAEVDLGFVGARLSAFATVAYGARYIGVIAFDHPAERSALYGAVGVEVQVQVSIEFWLHIDLGFFSIDFDFGLSLHLGFTALLEVGVTASDLIGARGTATISVGIMGYDLHFSIHVGLNEGAVQDALAITNPYLHIGLEAGEVEPIPGTTPTPAPGPSPAPLLAPAAALAPAAVAAFAAAPAAVPAPIAVLIPAPEPPLKFVGPDYVLMVIPSTAGDSCYFLIVPAPEPPPGEARCGFLPVPPAAGNPLTATVDFHWDIPLEAGITIQHFRPPAGGGASTWQNVTGPEEWHIRWEDPLSVDSRGSDGKQSKGSSSQTQTLADLFRFTFLPANSTVPQNNFQDYIPGGDPLPMPDREPGPEDDRVHNPSDGAYESAVRGAFEQFEGSPYLKGDDRSAYEQALKTAFDNATTVYTANGQVPPRTDPAYQKMLHDQQVMELRSTYLNGFISDAHEVAAAGNDPASPIATAKAGKFGLLFRTTGGIPSWLKASTVSAGTIRQRISPGAGQPDGRVATLRLFNPPEAAFATNPPEFDRLTHYTSSSTVTIAWDLFWPKPPNLPGRQSSVEDHLLFYHVQRQAIGDLEKAADSRRDFYVKNVSTVQVKDGVLQQLAPRFKFVDHFENETAEDIALLPPEGRTYVYTITPVDLGAGISPRPATIVAVRTPDLPPPVPTDAQLLVEYDLPAVPAASPNPVLVEPSKVEISFSAPPVADASGRPPVPAATYCLIFRQEKVLPVGSYAQDAASQGNRTDGLPTSNARPLRTDIRLPFRASAVTPSPTDSTRQVITISAQALRDANVLPKAGSWAPQAWRVFVQTFSNAPDQGKGVPSALDPLQLKGVPSALAPVQLNLRFRNTNPVEGKKDLFEERRPELLEWIANPLQSNFLAPEDDAAEAGLADVPMPLVTDGTPVVCFRTGAGSLDSLSFQRHPLNYRALRFRWNQANSTGLTYPREMHAGYELMEFDADAQTWPDTATPPSVEQVSSMFRRVQEVQLLSPDDLPLKPADNLATDLWEAWYPSTARRRWLLGQPNRFLQPFPKNSQAIYSPWFSWRDSYLVWPDDSVMPSLAAVAGRPPLTDPTLAIAGQTITISSGDLRSFANFRYLIVRGARLSTNNGVKRTIATGALSADGKTIAFEAGSFDPEPTPDPTRPVSPLTIEPLRPKLLHFFLVKLLDDLRRQADLEISPVPDDAVIDASALPAGQPVGPRDFLTETNPQRDPYGWNVLKRMGLAVAFTLRSRQYGVPITVPETQVRLKAKEDFGTLLEAVLARYAAADPAMEGFARHLHVEYLIQPGKSVRLDQDPDKAPDPDDDLALVQLSLRPAFEQIFAYTRYTVTVKPDPAATSPAQINLLVTANSDATTVIEHSGGGTPRELQNTQQLKLAISVPSDGTVILLVRASGNAPTVTADAGALKTEAFGPTDWVAAQFIALGSETWVPRDFGGKAGLPLVQEQWRRFQRYFARTISLIAEPPPHDPNGPPPTGAALDLVPLFFPWLQRFFDHSGDWDQAPVPGTARLGKTGLGPWPVAAYPRSSTPAYATPNSIGRVTYVHLIPDQWAHAFRYLILPYGRYDGLWKGLAASQFLAFDPEKASPAPPSLNAPTGGVDVVLHRLRPLAAPVILSSRRLDQAAGAEKQPTDPGRYWEVIVEKHPEQILVERNRSLRRHLSYCQIARTLLRRFSSLPEQKRVIQVIGGAFASRIAPVENHTAHLLPPALTQPDEVDPHDIDDLRSIALPDRVDTFGRGAFVLQWESLPFFYEHRLILVAQAAKIASPTTEVTQRDLTFVSPTPQATGEGIPADARHPGNGLQITIDLNSYWDCTPPDTQDRWSIEQPGLASGNQRRWSSLADPGVVYELVIARPSNALESQVEIAFSNPAIPLPATPAASDLYAATVRGKLFTPTVTGLIAPTGNTDPFQLVLQLKRNPSGVPLDLRSSVPVSASAPYAAIHVANVTFAEPRELVLVLTGTLTPAELDFLLIAGSDANGPIPRDVSFCNAVRQLAQAPNSSSSFSVTACLGLEQLSEVTPKAVLNPTGRTLGWRGFLLPDDRALINRWQDGSTFRAILDRLLAALDTTDAPEISVPLTAQPATAIPANLSDRLALEGDLASHTLALTWNGKFSLMPHQFAGLQSLLLSDLGPAVQVILNQLSGPAATATSVTIDPRDDWQPRPDLTNMPAALADKLLLGRARLQYPGPLLRADALALRNAAPSPADRRAIEQLFKDSLSAGLGGTLKIRARRSSAHASQLLDVEVAL